MGDVDACILLAEYYSGNNKQGLVNRDKEIDYYIKAAQKGNESAITQLQYLGVPFKTIEQQEKEEYDNRFWR